MAAATNLAVTGTQRVFCGHLSNTHQVASAWKEAGRLKDLKIEELSFQLGQVGGRCTAPGLICWVDARMGCVSQRTARAGVAGFGASGWELLASRMLRLISPLYQTMLGVP